MLGVIPANDPYQGLRLRRFFTAAAVYTGLIVLSGGYVVAGLMDPADWLRISAAIVTVNVGLFGLLRSGRNEQLPDPSLTLLQMMVACLLIAAVSFHVDGARGALLLVLMSLLLFGAFRLRIAAFLMVGAFAVACYASVVGLLWYFRPDAIVLDVAALQLMGLATAMLSGAFVVGYTGDLRRQLRTRQLELQRANETVHELSIQDTLTGAHNRREIVRIVREECDRARRLDMSLTVAILDLDRFKAINRRYDHGTGDEILKRVAAALEEGLRAVDAVGRYGGEEFLVVLPDTGLEGGRQAMESVARLLRGRLLQDVAHDLELTASVGVATYRPGEPTDALVERARECADEALDQGGDQVVAESGLTSGN